MRILSAFAFGMLFAVGLGVAGMTRPAKVIGFLDITGAWDPTLGIVMAAAVGVSSLLFTLILRRPASLLGERFDLPSTTRIDARLLGGAALFGIGWGLSGYCPGPAVVAAASGNPSTMIFLVSMLVGLYLGNWFSRPPHHGPVIGVSNPRIDR